MYLLFHRLNSLTSLSLGSLTHGTVSQPLYCYICYIYIVYMFMYMYVDGITILLFTDFCPIPLVMDYLKSNYDFWQSKTLTTTES